MISRRWSMECRRRRRLRSTKYYELLFNKAYVDSYNLLILHELHTLYFSTNHKAHNNLLGKVT